jgi:hypothetical protein
VRDYSAKGGSEGKGRGCGEVAGAAANCRDLPPAVVHPAEDSDWPIEGSLPRGAARRQNGLLRDVQVSEGSLSASIVRPREVFRTAILEATAHLILVHNHPSGDPTPSKEDVHLTRQLVEGARLLGLRVHDHVIIGRGNHVSLAQRGLI